METVELYSKYMIEKMAKKMRIWRIVLIVIVAASLAACITLAALTTTVNEDKTRLAAMITSAISGVVAIYIYLFPVTETKREASHAALMLEEERDSYAGTLSLSGGKVKIPGSVTVTRVTVTGDEGEKRFNVNVERLNDLPKDGGRYVFYTVHGYVAAYGRADDEALL